MRWDPELTIAALRFSNVMDPEDYAAFPSFDADARARKWNLWGYIDARDGAQAIRRALECGTTGFDRFIIAAADTVMSRPNAELVAEVFPGVPVKRDLGATRPCSRSTRPAASWATRPSTPGATPSESSTFVTNRGFGVA